MAWLRVAHHAEVGPLAAPAPQQPELERVDVLELVDEEVPEPPALRGGELVVGLDQVAAAQPQQVVEVDHGVAGASRPRSAGTASAIAPVVERRRDRAARAAASA